MIGRPGHNYTNYTSAKSAAAPHPTGERQRFFLLSLQHLYVVGAVARAVEFAKIDILPNT